MIIPFFIPHAGCPHQCVFCNQKNITGQKIQPDVSAIPRTINSYVATSDAKRPAQVAFYGGSFTALPLNVQRSYLEAVRPFIDSNKIQSIRISTRPDCINPGVLKLLKQYHVETVELGAQSMDDRVLTLSERGHSAEDTARSVGMLREFSFKIGLQLMPGLPGDTPDIFSDTVGRTIALKPDFVRLYPAMVIRDTPLAQLFTAGRYSPLALDEAVLLCKQALLRFESSGINVIRIGLQSTGELEQPGVVLAGPFHPAFRQMVESSLLLDGMIAALMGKTTKSAVATFHVHPDDLSSAIGQKKSNIKTLRERFGLKDVEVRPDITVPRRRANLTAVFLTRSTTA